MYIYINLQCKNWRCKKQECPHRADLLVISVDEAEGTSVRQRLLWFLWRTGFQTSESFCPKLRRSGNSSWCTGSKKSCPFSCLFIGRDQLENYIVLVECQLVVLQWEYQTDWLMRETLFFSISNSINLWFFEYLYQI